MASNGTSTVNGDTLSFAEQMQRQHAEAHNVTVEDAIDEEDIAHPPPSLQAVDQPLSEKAKGKQPARESSAPAPSKGLDTSSEELFPALGAGGKKVASGFAPAWGAGGRPASMTANGATAAPRAPPSAMPAARVGTAWAPSAGVNLPGKQQQTLELKNSQMQPISQRKKPIDRMLNDIEKRVGGVKITTVTTSGGIQFIATGKPEKLQTALQTVAKELGSNQKASVPVPVSVKPHLIGKGGVNIKAIQEKTGARIQVPKTEPSLQLLGEDDDATIDVTIEGDAVAAEQARQMVEQIVNERTSSMGTRLREIPPELYHFIAGPHNLGLEALRNGQNLDIKVPQYTSRHAAAPALTQGQPMQFAPHPHSHIQLSGDRQAVQQARTEIERQASELRRSLAFEELSLPRGQHQLILGENANAVHDLLAETGCTIILPHDDEDTEMLHVVGPRDRIEAGRDKLYELASAMSSQPVDLGRAHPNAPEAYRRNLARYLMQRKALRELENKYNSKVSLPPGDAPYWEVYSADRKGLLPARNELLNIVGAHPPQRFMPVDLDPYFHQHLREEHAPRLRHEHGVHILFPEDDSEPLVLVFEEAGTPAANFVTPRQRPSPTDIQDFERALQQAQAEILALAHQHGPVSSRGVEAPRQYHDKIRKFVNRKQQEGQEGALPIQLLPLSQAQAQNPQLMLRGPEGRMDPLIAAIMEFVEQEKRDEKERGFTTSFDFPQKFANHLIGRGGEGINKLRDEFDVEIQVKDGQVELKGPQAKCEAAKHRILNLAKRLEDETTHVLKIPKSYHPELIGAKGSQVNRLQDRYKVRVQFPKTNVPRDDDSVADSEPRSRSLQGLDEIHVRGPRKGADEARDELLSLFQYLKDNSNTATVSVAQAQLPSIIGSGGREIERIREQTGAKVDVPNRDEVDSSGRVDIQLKGTKKQVEDAKKLLTDRAKEFDDRVSKVVHVPKKYLQSLIGAGGNNIRGIMIAAGVPDDRQELARAVRFPDAKSESTEVRIEQKKNVAEKIATAISTFVKDRENQIHDTIDIPTAQHRVLIGHGGQTRRALEEQFKVNIDIPKQGSGSSTIKIAGMPENVARAKEHIAGFVKQEEGISVNVPRNLHHAISDRGRFFSQVRSNHGVRVDYGTHRPPPRPDNIRPKGRTNGASGAMPLITDTAPTDPVAGHSWELVDAYPSGEEGEIPWILHGKPEDTAKVQALIQQAIAQAQGQDAAGFLILPDPSLHKLVIGQGGATINSIRKDTGCKITVPKQDARDEAIEILGSKEGVEEAKERIIEAIQKGGRGGRRGD